MTSRIDLDDDDRRKVERVRARIAELGSADTGTATVDEALILFGDALGQADILLRVIDGGES